MKKKKRTNKDKKILPLEKSIEYLALLKKQNKGTLKKHEKQLLYEFTKEIESRKNIKIKPQLERNLKVIQTDEEEYMNSLILSDLKKRQTVIKKEPLKTSNSTNNPSVFIALE